MKLRQITAQWTTYQSTNDYIGPMVYKDGVLDYIITSEGRAVYSGGSFNHYEYHLKDHLGNIRIAFKNNGGTPLVTQRNDYYPFGLLMRQNGTSTNKYLYNGKEEMKYTDEGIGVDMNWADYGARMYDPQLGRWHVVDLLSFLYYSYSPYNYVLNNPINNIDPFGLDVWSTSDPEAIKRFIQQVKSQGNATYGGEGWDRTSDSDFLKGLSFNDKTSTYSFTRGFVKNGEAGILSMTFPSLRGFPDRSISQSPTSGTIDKPNAIDQWESWLSSKSESRGEMVSKAALNVLYDIPNAPVKLLTGQTIGGVKVTPSEKTDAFVSTAPGTVMQMLKLGTVIKANAKWQSFLKSENRISNASASAAYKVQKSNEALIESAGMTQDVVQKASEFIKNMQNDK